MPFPVAAIPALIGVIGILLQNKWIVLIGFGIFLFMINAFVGLPPYIWVIAAIIIFFWMMDNKGGKRR